MLIFFVPDSFGALDPIVVCDYTRSDEQYSILQIEAQAEALGVLQNPGKIVLPVAPYNIFSLDYQMKYSHVGINYGDSLKTDFTAILTNPPMELVNLLNIKQYNSSQNIGVISNTLVSKVIDPRVQFPTGAFVIKKNSNAATSELIKRTFMVYGTEFNYNERRTDSHLTIKGAAFDSMVIKLQFSANIDKKKPLIFQLNKLAASGGFILNYDPVLSAIMPIVSKFYEPQPATKLINNICTDNNLFFDFDSTSKIIKIKSLEPSAASYVPQGIFCFNGIIPGANIANMFSLQNYFTCEVEGEAFDCSLFDFVTVYDDTMSSGQFSNLSKIPFPFPSGKNLIDGYKFYVLSYSYEDSRLKTSIKFTGTNNWILSNLKIDNFLEAKIYGGL